MRHTDRQRKSHDGFARVCALALVSAALAAACDGGTVEPVAGGTLHVQMRTSGASLDGDGYSYQVGTSSVPLRTQDTLDIEDLPTGPVAVTLGGLANNCRAFSPGPTTVTVPSGEIDTVSLVVSCDSALRNVVLVTRSPTPMHPEVWTMRPDGSNATRFLTDASDPVATPNGTFIVFRDWTTLRLGIVRADGTRRHPAVPDLGGGQFEPFVSPDGSFMLFARSTEAGSDIYRSNLDGGDIQQLTNGAFDTQPHSSPDGQSLTFTRWAGGGQVLRLSVEGGDPVPLTGVNEGCCARWSPDGARLLYFDETTAGWSTMAPDGTGTQALEALPASTTSVQWSPDGHELMTVRWEELVYSTWRMPLEGNGVMLPVEAVSVGQWLP